LALDLERPRARIRATIPHRGVPFWRAQALTLACVLTAAVLRWPLGPLLGGQIPFVTFFPAVLLASIWGGSWAGVTAVALNLVTAGASWGGNQFGLRFEILPTASLVAFVIFGGVVVLLTDLLRAALKDLARSERQAQLLASEMRHRVKNALAMAKALSRQTARGATSVLEYQALLEGRLDALAHAPEYAPRIDLDPPPLPILIGQVLEPFDLQRFERSGPPLPLPPHLGGTFALVLHELATNATKHGASIHAHRYGLSDLASGCGSIIVDWVERGGPAVSGPVRLGFGSRLLTSAFPDNQAIVALDYQVEGVRCRITLVAPPVAGAEKAAAGKTTTKPAEA